MEHIGIEVGDLLRPHRAGMARYAECLLTALTEQGHSDAIHAWAPWRRAFGWFAKPKAAIHFFGGNPPTTRPSVFHATACVYPRWKSSIEVATVHDLLAIHEDLRLSPSDMQKRTEYIRRADRIICVSHHTRKHLHQLLDIPMNRSVAIPLAAASRFAPASTERKQALRRRRGLPQEFLLFIGRDRRNKNLDRLTMAYAASRLSIPLYIVGQQKRATRERLLRLADNNDCVGPIRWLGSVRDDELPVLLSCASALCMPSTFEGFGLPVIEAMACGTPVVTSAGRATEEAAGGKAVLINPESVESIADGLLCALQMTNAQRDDARQYAARRTWHDVATETWRVYNGEISSN